MDRCVLEKPYLGLSALALCLLPIYTGWVLDAWPMAGLIEHSAGHTTGYSRASPSKQIQKGFPTRKTFLKKIFSSFSVKKKRCNTQEKIAI